MTEPGPPETISAAPRGSSGSATAGDEVLAAYKRRVFDTFGWYLERYFAKSFDAVRILNRDRLAVPAGRPIIAFNNHASWWDAILMLLLSDQLFNERRCFGPMDAKALEKYRFMRWCGVFGVEQDSARGAARFLAISRTILNAGDTVLWMTPQGRFSDPRERPITFKPGLAHIARDFPQATLIPIAFEYPFWTERNPETLVNIGEPVIASEVGRKTTAQWDELLAGRLGAAMDELAEAAMSGDPDRFETLIEGRARVSLAYDAWRWLKARITGKSFSAAHREGAEHK